jgi:thiol-disulfide isomerase/thioredoxin
MSCRHSALSKGIEAFISRMIAKGPPCEPSAPHLVDCSTLLSLAAAYSLPGAIGKAGRTRNRKRASTAPAPAADVGTIDRTRKGSELPDFLLTDPAGKELRLTDLKGKPLLINLWATWCAPCVARKCPLLDQVAADYAGRARCNVHHGVSQDLGASRKRSRPALPEAVNGVTAISSPGSTPKGDLALSTTLRRPRIAADRPSSMMQRGAARSGGCIGPIATGPARL